MKTAPIFVFIILAMITLKTSAQDVSAYKQEVFSKNGHTMPYRILLPKEYDVNKKYPMLLMLHGAGERGDDNQVQLTHGADLFLNKEIMEDYPAIVVFPQCPKNSYWSNVDKKVSDKAFTFDFKEKGKPTQAMATLLKLVKQLKQEYKVDKNRIYVGGLSMGGMGTFEIVRRDPETFAAAFTICGGAHPDTASKLTKTDWWVFHGDADVVVDYQHSLRMVDALKKVGAHVKFTIYEGVNHNSWENAFAEPDLLPWLFSKSK